LSIVEVTPMLRVKLFSLLFLVLLTSLGHAENFGRYIGTVQTEWLDTDTRRMRLLAPFTYVDPNGVTWTAPAGWVIDGASIPVFAWSVIGGPFNGRYRDASVIHDVACDQKAQPWEMVHEAFYWAMLASGVESWRAKVMYAAVYHFGPRWPRVVTVANLPKGQARGVARDEALSQADPGSNATIIRVKPHPGGQATPGTPERADVEVQIQPPPRKLKEQDFEQLKQRILEAEAPPAAEPAPAPEAPSAAPGAPKPAPSPNTGTGGAGGAGGGSDARARGFFHRRSAPAETGTSRGLAARPQRGGVSLSEIRSFEPNQ
jgi:hypothetical protein